MSLLELITTNSHNQLYRNQADAKRRANSAPKQSHSHTGFPHFNSSGRCMCLFSCCQRDNGCVCRGCRGHENCLELATARDKRNPPVGRSKAEMLETLREEKAEI